ncbi:LAFA_0E17238g1_1 [Lachancea sp. 'fantastica']|nr:LAFA_0E17238g1_1 [Lachancea sp. 'fantastica']
MNPNPATQVEEWLTVGRLDASLALLTTKNHHVIEFPTMLLPDNIKAGTIVKIQVSEDQELQQQELERFESLQDEIMEKYGTHRPQKPVLKSINVTQTSGVLGWDPLELGSAQLKSLVLYKDGVRSLLIPNPYKTTATKFSGLSVDSEYSFQLKLSTTSGDLWSDKIVLHTHKMTDMSGITACLGSLDAVQNVTAAHIEASLKNIGAKPMQSRVTLDTTHFISNEKDGDDSELKKAQQSNIPIVRPEWVRACELERRIVGVRGFYLDADPINIEGYKFTKLPSEVPENLQPGKPSTSTRGPDSEVPQTEISADSAAISTASLKSVTGALAPVPSQPQESGSVQETADSNSEQRPSELGAEESQQESQQERAEIEQANDQVKDVLASEQTLENIGEKGAELNEVKENDDGQNDDDNNDKDAEENQDQKNDEFRSGTENENTKTVNGGEIETKTENNSEVASKKEDETTDDMGNLEVTGENVVLNDESEEPIVKGDELSPHFGEPGSQVAIASEEINMGVDEEVGNDSGVKEKPFDITQATEPTQPSEQIDTQDKTVTEAEASTEAVAAENSAVADASGLVDNTAPIEIPNQREKLHGDEIEANAKSEVEESIPEAVVADVSHPSGPNEISEPSAELEHEINGEDGEAESTPEPALNATNGAQTTGKKKKNKKNKKKGKK